MRLGMFKDAGAPASARSSPIRSPKTRRILASTTLARLRRIMAKLAAVIATTEPILPLMFPTSLALRTQELDLSHRGDLPAEPRSGPSR